MPQPPEAIRNGSQHPLRPPGSESARFLVIPGLESKNNNPQAAVDSLERNDLKGVLDRILEELASERLAAKARHAEVMVAMRSQVLACADIRENEWIADESHKPSAGSSTHNIFGGERSLSPTSRSKQDFISRARKASQDDTGPERSNSKKSVHLASDSALRFGTKYESESSGESGTCLRLIGLTAKRVVEHDAFEMAIAGLIMANAMCMGLEVQYAGIQLGSDLKYERYNNEADELWPGAEKCFSVFQWIFGILFLLEAILKFIAIGYRYFCAMWNWVDFIAVVAFVVDKFVASITGSANPMSLRLLRMFRLVRLIRLIRTLENMDILYIMTTAIKGMSMVVLWAVCLLSLMLSTCALFLTQFLHSTYFDNPARLASSDQTAGQEMYKYFGTFSRCLLSMFEITLANWPPVTRLLTEEVSEWFSPICLLHKLTIGFAVIGVINGVILQETFKVAHTDDMVMVRQKKRAQRAMEKKMESLFAALDIDKVGRLTFQEFTIIASQPEVKLWLESLEIETDDLLTLFLLLDEDRDGTLSLEELLTQVPRLRGVARSIDMVAVRRGVPPFNFLEEKDPKSPTGKKFRWSQAPGMSRELGQLDVVVD